MAVGAEGIPVLTGVPPMTVLPLCQSVRLCEATLTETNV